MPPAVGDLVFHLRDRQWIKGCDGVVEVVRCKMGIPHRHRERGVAEQLRDGKQRYSLLDEATGESVTKVMDLFLFQRQPTKTAVLQFQHLDGGKPQESRPLHRDDAVFVNGLPARRHRSRSR
jgi:hypothetical protein